jgi:hypothetical protein
MAQLVESNYPDAGYGSLFDSQTSQLEEPMVALDDAGETFNPSDIYGAFSDTTHVYCKSLQVMTTPLIFW